MTGRFLRLTVRTSDALALAIRDKAPIYIGQKLLMRSRCALKGRKWMKSTQEELEDKLSDIEEQLLGDNTGQDLSKLTTVDELEELLQQALDQEDYERAAIIRDELSKR